MSMIQTMTPTSSSGRILEVPAGLSIKSPTPFKIKNHLANHPLFTDERIKKLLRTLPRERIEIRDVQPLGQDDGSYKRGKMLADADPIATFERLAEKPSWMLLHESWIHDGDFGQLLRDYVVNLQQAIPDVGDQLSELGCWVFLSSGRCVVHFHADPDQSFLNQIRGGKTVFVYPASVLPEEQVEKLVYTHDQGAAPYDPSYEAKMFEPTHLSPGESVFLPLFAPHRVTNDDGISVSLNVGFHTKESRDRMTVHLFNLELRHMGMKPRPANESPLVDSVKRKMHLAIRARNRLFKSLKTKVTV